MAVLFCSPSTSSGSTRILYSEGNSASNTPLLEIGLDGTDRALVYAHDDAAGEINEVEAVTSYSDDSWHLMVLTVGSRIKVYMNGSEVIDVENTLGATTLDVAGIGSLRRAADSQEWVGSIGYFASCASALTPSEVSLLHNYIRRQVAGRGISLPAA